jgi:hypothetical protein
MFRCLESGSGLGGRVQWGSPIILGSGWLSGAEAFLVTCGCFDLVC